jgi:hypothetical protein
VKLVANFQKPSRELHPVAVKSGIMKEFITWING